MQLLLKTLNEVKESSASIDQSLIESGQIRRKLMLEYDQYKAVCESAAKFFNGINKIYKITVTVFTNLFLKSISHHDVSIEGLNCSNVQTKAKQNISDSFYRHSLQTNRTRILYSFAIRC